MLAPVGAFAAPAGEGAYYVTASVLNVRLAPHDKARLAGRVQRDQIVEVFEMQDGWARISPYYTGGVEGMPGIVARWVFVDYIAPAKVVPVPPVKAGPIPVELVETGEATLSQLSPTASHPGL